MPARALFPAAPLAALALAGALLAAPVGAQNPAAEPAADAGPDAAAPPQRGPAPALRYVVVDGASIADPLTDAPGDAARGREIYADPERGGCLACHALKGLGPRGAGDPPGPALDAVGGRLPAGAIRLWIVNPALRAEAPGKPAYFSLADAPEGTAPGRSRLSAQEVEDIVAFLGGLR